MNRMVAAYLIVLNTLILRLIRVGEQIALVDVHTQSLWVVVR